ncbi:bacteriocin immunity protein [Streptococcus hongkongensis]|nr:hypothetical protein NC01_05700 [Streptococcus uberis]
MKNKLSKEWLLENIYNLILDIDISEKEREILMYAKIELENNRYDLQVARILNGDLSTLALQQQLSEKVIAFSLELQKRTLLNNKIGPNSILFF